MNLRAARIRAGWDEWQLARILEVHVSHIRGIEDGTQWPSRLVLSKIRKVLGKVELEPRVPEIEPYRARGARKVG